jgi:hypothetical protein
MILFVISLDFLFLLMHREFEALEKVYIILHIDIFILYRILTIGLPVTTNNTKWLIYWIIYVLFSFLDYFYQTLPFYWFGKCFFLIWLMILGPTGGINRVYYRIIRPFILNYFEVSFKMIYRIYVN